jgi:uridine kinase
MLLNNKEVYLPKYDMSGTTKRFDNHKLAKPSSVVLAEGLYTLIEGVGDIFDFKIYVDIDRSVQKKRFFERAQQRGLGASADKIFANAAQKAQIHVHPCIENADIVLNGEISREKYQKFINSMLLLIESVSR